MIFSRIRPAALCLMAACAVLLSAGCGKSDAPPEQKSDQGEAPAAAPAPAAEEIVQLPTDPRNDWDKIDDPSADGWSTEAFSEHAAAQLDLLGALFFKEGDASALLAPGFTCAQLIVEPTPPVFDDGRVSVERATAPFTPPGDAGLLEKSFTAVRSQLAGNAAAQRFKFKITRVETGDAHTRTEQLFSLSYQTADAIVEIHARWDVRWLDDGKALKIAEIRLADFERSTTRRDRQGLFTDVTASALGATDCYATQLSYGMNHWLGRLPVRAMLNRFGTPGLAVGDVDGDGRDDLYLCQEPGLPNRLFLQNEDGSAREVAAEWGVDWIDDSRSALLLDLDNDGDQDLAVAIHSNIVVARNDGGRFVVAAALPASASTASLAAADYDGDGLVDLFVCGYVAEDRGGASMGAAAERFVYHDAENGAPNFLYHNDGSLGFSDATRTSGLDQNNRRWSFAASWEDFDNDGDQDLYVANDYGRNNLYRNQGGKFEDVAAGAGVEDSASGMSVSWGDYDRDGRMDVYVSNMFSAAGSRITTQEKFKSEAGDEIRQRFRRFARGNSLFRNLDGAFDDVSVGARVTMGRWAWGSNFADLNNDAWPDLVVANGYLSADDDSGDL